MWGKVKITEKAKNNQAKREKLKYSTIYEWDLECVVCRVKQVFDEIILFSPTSAQKEKKWRRNSELKIHKYPINEEERSERRNNFKKYWLVRALHIAEDFSFLFRRNQEKQKTWNQNL